MRVLTILCLLIVSIEAQDTTYWQTGYYQGLISTVKSLSDQTHIFTTLFGEVQITYDNFKTHSDLSTHFCESNNALTYDNYMLFGGEEFIYRINLETGQEETLAPISARKFLYCSDSLFYLQSMENQIFKSSNQGESWTFIRNANQYFQWGVLPDGKILLVPTGHYVYLSNSTFTDSTLITQYSGVVWFNYRPYFQGNDTLMFCSSHYLYKSFNGGNTFEKTQFESRIEQGIESDINGNLFILTRDELLKSTDKGGNWFPVLRRYGINGGFHIYEDKINVAFWELNAHGMYHDPEVGSPRFDNFLPLAVGNRWFYKVMDKPFEFQEVEIYDSVEINSELYYCISNFPYPLRYENNRLLYYVNGADSLYTDFNIPAGQATWFRYQEDTYTMREEYFEMFDTTRYSKGPYYSTGVRRECELFSPELGKIFSTTFEGNGATTVAHDSLLVQAIIKTSEGVKKYNDVPAPLFDGQIDVDYYSDHLAAKINVFHSYSIESNIENACFIDSVKMYYFLTDGTNSTESVTVTGERITETETYIFNCQVDNSLFAQGYELNCYYKAWTKGIITIEKRFPELGYIPIQGGTVNLNDPKMVNTYNLENNFPNPFNPSTTLSYSLAKSSFVTLDVFNIKGEKVTSLVNENQSAGEYNVKFDGSNLTSGVYFGRISASTNSGEVFNKSIKMILMK